MGKKDGTKCASATVKNPLTRWDEEEGKEMGKEVSKGIAGLPRFKI